LSLLDASREELPLPLAVVVAHTRTLPVPGTVCVEINTASDCPLLLDAASKAAFAAAQ
jgi:hypothetical protein